MRKILLFTVSATLAIANMNAIDICPERIAPRALVKNTSDVSWSTGTKVTMKSSDAENPPVKWGYSLTEDFYELQSLGAGQEGTYSFCYFVPGGKTLAESSIVGFSLPVISTQHISALSVWVNNTLDDFYPGKTKADRQYSCPVEYLSDMKFNTLGFPEAYPIPEGGCYIGFNLTIDAVESDGDKFPIITSKVHNDEGGFFLYMTTWGDISKSFGDLAFITLVDKITTGPANAHILPVNNISVLSGSDFVVPLIIENNGTAPINDIDCNVDLGGNEIQTHIEFENPISSGFVQRETFSLPLQAPVEAGIYGLNISVGKVNGVDNLLSDCHESALVKALTKIVDRNSVLEERTSLLDSDAPTGIVTRQAIRKAYENAIVIAIHDKGDIYNEKDPLDMSNFYANNSTLGLSYDHISIDRHYTSLKRILGRSGNILTDFVECNSIIPDADVSIQAEFNETMTAVDINAEVEYLLPDQNYRISFALTADSVMRLRSNWRQLNMYSTFDPSYFSELPDEFSPITDYCRGGKYGMHYIAGLPNDDVLIGSSFSNDWNLSDRNLAPQLSETHEAGTTETVSYTIDNIHEAAMKVINPHKVYAIAIITDTDGTIVNAAKVQVMPDETPETPGDDDALGDVKAEKVYEVEYYNLSGVKLSGPQPGINIVRMSDGSVIKKIKY